MTAEAHFRAVAPGYMRKLMSDFPQLTRLDAAAVFGNLGHESLGFTALQEIKPTVNGSRGGFGWAQWTGPRRRAFESYCARNGLSARSDAANYAFLFVELTGSHQSALAATAGAGSLEEKVRAFELAYERAGVKHYDGRNAWARIALDALEKSPPAPVPADEALAQPPRDTATPTVPDSAVKAPIPVAPIGAGIIVALLLAALICAFLFHPH